jgi:uncharacterized protein YcnI
MRTILVSAIALMAGIATLSAHVTVSPREASAGATERYTVHVPTEGQVATVSVDLEVPDGVTVTEVPPIDGVVIDTRRAGDRIVTITWKREIKPRETANFTFVAKNPALPATVMWKAHQHFADGTTAHWIGMQVIGSPRP